MANFRAEILTGNNLPSGDSNENAIVAAKLLDASQQAFRFTRVADTSPQPGLELLSLDSPPADSAPVTGAKFHQATPFVASPNTFADAPEYKKLTPAQANTFSNAPDSAPDATPNYVRSDSGDYRNLTPTETPTPQTSHTSLGTDLGLVAVLGALAMKPTASRKIITGMIMDGARLGGRAVMHNPKMALAITAGLFIEHELGLDRWL
jgi:hypothetical protein